MRTNLFLVSMLTVALIMLSSCEPNPVNNNLSEGDVTIINDPSQLASRLVFGAGYVPLSTFYTGYFLRFARLLAHTQELFNFSSYKDPWNPRKTSEVAQSEGI